MAEEETAVVVLRDPSGVLYTVPVSVIESYRVPDEQRAELESRLGSSPEEIQGYAMYMKYGAIQGQTTGHPHPNWFELNSFQWGVGHGPSSTMGSPLKSGYNLSTNQQP